MRKPLLIILIFLSCAKEANSDLIDQYQLQISQLNSQITQLNSQLSQSQSKILELQSTINTLNNQVATIDNLEETITTLNSEITILELNISQLETEVSLIPQLENTISLLNTEISTLESVIGDLSSGLEGLENLEQRISTLNSQVQTIPDLEQTIASLNIEIIELESTINFLNSESTVPELQETIANLEATILDLNSGFSNINDLSQANWLENKLSSLASQVEYLQAQIVALNLETLQFQSLSSGTLQNETGVNLLLDALYSSLDGVRGEAESNGTYKADWHIAGNNWWMDVISDDAHKGSTDGDQANLLAIELFTWDTSNVYFLFKWDSLIQSVNRANAVIELINNSENPIQFNSQLAQARFLRGHFYFELQKMWENVPYISVENYSADELNQPNTGSIWNEIEEDFIFASINLPPSRGESYSEFKRPIQTTAKSYLGKVYLYQQNWAAALNEFESVINSGLYALQSNYFANWKSATENGSEMIFSIQFTSDSGQSINGNRGGTMNYPIGPMTGGMCCGFYQPTQDLANAFQTDSNGLPLSNWASSDISNDFGIETDEPFTPHTGPLDPRIDYTIGRRGIEFNGFGIFTGAENIRASFTDISGPYASKKNMYYAGDDANRGTGGWGEQRSGINHHIIRYADILLMAAESAIELGQLEKGRGYVNQVRTRAKNSPRADSSPNYVIDTYNSPWTDQSIARNAVRHERRVELAMEGHRLFDLRRWGIMVETLNIYIDNESRTIPAVGARSNQVLAKHIRFPIPLDAINYSDGILTQNPGF